MAMHRWTAKTSTKPLYRAMRKYGNFEIMLLKTFETREELIEAEIKAIAEARSYEHHLYNLADGGEGGFVITDPIKKLSWIEKLKVARKGAKPALGMKHTEENKKFFSECNKRKIPTYPNIDFSLGFAKCNKIWGISKTHYYRLRKRNDSI